MIGAVIFAIPSGPPAAASSTINLQLILRPEFAMGFGEPSMELFDPHVIQRVRAQKPEPLAAAVLAVVFREALPETDRSIRVVSGTRHVNQAQMVGLRLLFATVRQFAAHLRRHS